MKMDLAQAVDLYLETRRRFCFALVQVGVELLCEASAQQAGRRSFRASTLCALLGLLYRTGLRIGEALGLSDPDINWSEGVLTIRHAKNGRTRLVPVEPSTVQALRRYRRLREKAVGSVSSPRLFVNGAGDPLGYLGVSATFRKVCRDLGWTQPPIPRLHDLRHYADLRIMPHQASEIEETGRKVGFLSPPTRHSFWDCGRQRAVHCENWTIALSKTQLLGLALV